MQAKRVNTLCRQVIADIDGGAASLYKEGAAMGEAEVMERVRSSVAGLYQSKKPPRKTRPAGRPRAGGQQDDETQRTSHGVPKAAASALDAPSAGRSVASSAAVPAPTPPARAAASMPTGMHLRRQGVAAAPHAPCTCYVYPFCCAAGLRSLTCRRRPGCCSWVCGLEGTFE